MGNQIATLMNERFDEILYKLATSSSTVLTIDSKERWDTHFEKFKKSPNIVVIDFTASWYPNKVMEQAIKTMADEYTGVEFVKIDVDAVKAVAKKYYVDVLPTYVFLKEGKQVEKLVGAKKEELEKKIVDYGAKKKEKV